MKRNLILLALAAVTLSLSACAEEPALPRPQGVASIVPVPPDHLPAPLGTPDKFIPGVAVTYRLDRIEVGHGEACPINDAGQLIIFSETAFANQTGDTLWVRDVQLHPGDSFVASTNELLKDKFVCNGKEWEAIRIIDPGIDKAQ